MLVTRCQEHLSVITHARGFSGGELITVISSPRIDGMSAELLEWRSAFTSKLKQPVVARMRWPQSVEIRCGRWHTAEMRDRCGSHEPH